MIFTWIYHLRVEKQIINQLGQIFKIREKVKAQLCLQYLEPLVTKSVLTCIYTELQSAWLFCFNSIQVHPVCIYGVKHSIQGLLKVTGKPLMDLWVSKWVRRNKERRTRRKTYKSKFWFHFFLKALSPQSSVYIRYKFICITFRTQMKTTD